MNLNLKLVHIIKFFVLSYPKTKYNILYCIRLIATKQTGNKITIFCKPHYAPKIFLCIYDIAIKA